MKLIQIQSKFKFKRILPLVCKSISQMSLCRPHSISLDAAQHIQQSTGWSCIHALLPLRISRRLLVVSLLIPWSFSAQSTTQHDIGHVPAIHHGRVNESHAAQLYVEKQKDEGRPVVIQECGLCLHQECRFLGASLDRIVYDNSTEDCFGLLEVKCPYKAYTLHKTVWEACDDSQFCCTLIDGKPHLKTTHAYYHQIQGQMAITGLKQ